MNLKISCKHMNHSPVFDQHIREKSEKFEKYFQGNLNVQWFFWVENGVHWSELKIHGPKFDFFAKGSADNMYKALDCTMEKMEKQIDKQKNIKRQFDTFDAPKYKEMKKQIRDEEDYIYHDAEEWSA